MKVYARFLKSFDHAQPHRPNRIDENVRVVRLNQEGGVPDPGDADLPRLHFWKKRARAGAGTLGEERRDPDLRDEIALGPFATRTQLDALRFLRSARGTLADDLTLSRKRIRHCPKTI
jgi:hypothetical protein